MQDDEKVPHISQYKSTIPSWRQDGDKYRGVIGCSMTGSATDPSFHEFITEELFDTSDDAMRGAVDLHHKLATAPEEE